MLYLSFLAPYVWYGGGNSTSAEEVLQIPASLPQSWMVGVRKGNSPPKTCSNIPNEEHDENYEGYTSSDAARVNKAQGRSVKLAMVLRSAAAGHLVVPATKTKTIETKSFHYSAPTVWNSLSLQLRDCSLTYENFKRLLKTCLF